eukprot:TRINITY_DN10625_c0_g2_i1.p1 TRINITY_DN10625_c0_g2~~TRINITY_DN10625_c0_g2_i1.p1  ORF type:complete len:255 (+),score=56.12 TRINITY_DN10625_c0_g2_i1:73-837(+)
MWWCCQDEKKHMMEVIQAIQAAPSEDEFLFGHQRKPTADAQEAEVTPAGQAESEEAPKIEPMKEEEPATLSTFDVACLAEKDASLGLEVLATTVNHLVIKQLQQGVVSDYNLKQASTSMKVLPYDRIIAVNGETSTADILEARINSNSDTITLKVEKPRVLGVMITRSDDKLGVYVQPKADLGLVVTGIQAGCLFDYNQRAPLSRQVKVNDIIIGRFLKDAGGKSKVDKSKSPDELMRYLQSEGPIGLAVLSYS